MSVSQSVQRASKRLDARGISVNDKREQTAGEVTGIGPSLELERLGFLRLFAIGGGRIGIASVGAHQPVHHQFQHAWCLIPVHGRDDHDAVRRDPARVDLVHPVVDLTHRVVRIARAGPVAQRHRRGHAGLARKDLPAVLGREQTQVEQIAGDARTFELLTRQLHEPEGLGHLTGARLIVARGRGDEQHW
jgi:hypothetical protein